MLHAMTVVPADYLDDLVIAVERLQWLRGDEAARVTDVADPILLLDALCDVYAASQRLVHPTARSAPPRPAS